MLSKQSYLSILVLGATVAMVSAENRDGVEKAQRFRAAQTEGTKVVSVVSESATENPPLVDDFARMVLEQKAHAEIEELGGSGYTYTPVYTPGILPRPCWFCYPYTFCCP